MLTRIVSAIFGDPNEKVLKKLQPTVQRIAALEKEFEGLTDEQLRGKTQAFRQRLSEGATLDELLPEAYAAVREASKRTLGLRHYDVQMIGGIVLHQGKIAEMKTGEGKTLVASLPLYLNALEGKGAHLVTPNDYLSKFGAQSTGPIYHALGISVSVIQSQSDDAVFQPAFLFDPDYQSDDDRLQNLRPIPREEAYQADITYGTNNEFGFDYLRDNMVRMLSQRVQRPLHYAIIDEVDNILIDEARTPLIISGPAEEPSEMYGRMARLVESFKPLDQRTYDQLRKDADLGDSKALEQIASFDFVLDEKQRVTTVLERGIERVERALGIENLYAEEHFALTHFLDNAVRAHGLYQRDRDYIVNEKGEVVIIDEFTGRQMWGRRFSEGLHQAIEAKEGVTVQRENLTLATITFQNYFRMYRKLAGMTGTALTEQEEFGKIYNLDVVAIPTNRPNVRDDYADQIFKSERGKYAAVIREIVAMVAGGRPVLVGTASIDRSELISRLLSAGEIQAMAHNDLKRLAPEEVRPKTMSLRALQAPETLAALAELWGIPDEARETLHALLAEGVTHNVLNAKQHEREAEIIAQAGRPGTVTIATNMAGRGVDILLGGNPEGMARRELRREFEDLTQVPAERWQQVLAHSQALAEADGAAVRERGGLHVIGTERHDARRIDNQLRGRAGRQGDPGSTRFYLSLEDDLMRRFGGGNMASLMERLGLDEETPIEAGMVSKAIENAQVKVEGYNFDIRKRVLEYDDVVNKQREVIYAQRTEVLSSENLRPDIERMIEGAIRQQVDGMIDAETEEMPDFTLLLSALRTLIPLGDHDYVQEWEALFTQHHHQPEKVAAAINEQMRDEMKRIYDEREEGLGAEVMRDIERQLMLAIVDQLWQRHLTDLDHLRQGIGLRAVAQVDPLVAYKTEAAGLWNDLMGHIEESVISQIFLASGAILEQKFAQREMHVNRSEAGEAPAGPQKAAPVRTRKVPGRNAPCWCGSGKKYKQCHWVQDQKQVAQPELQR